MGWAQPNSNLNFILWVQVRHQPNNDKPEIQLMMSAGGYPASDAENVPVQPLPEPEPSLVDIEALEAWRSAATEPLEDANKL